MVDFVSSGASLLNLVLTSLTEKGWPLGRMIRVAGDPSTGKTQLAIEAAAAFKKAYPNGIVKYIDAEAAFDVDYASRLGLDLDEEEDFIYVNTVEEFGEAIDKFLDSLDGETPAVIFLDSWDALLSDAQKEGGIADEKGYEAGRRAQKIKTILKKAVTKLRDKNVLLFGICQTYDNVTGYGPKKLVGGGNAIKFFSSINIMLSLNEKLTKTINGEDVLYGISVNAYCDKNKVAPPFRECDYFILFNRGIDDIASCIAWLEKRGKLDLLGEDIYPTPEKKPAEKKPAGEKKEKAQKVYPKIVKRIADMDRESRRSAIKIVRAAVQQVWDDVGKQLNDRVDFVEDEED